MVVLLLWKVQALGQQLPSQCLIFWMPKARNFQQLIFLLSWPQEPRILFCILRSQPNHFSLRDIPPFPHTFMCLTSIRLYFEKKNEFLGEKSEKVRFQPIGICHSFPPFNARHILCLSYEDKKQMWLKSWRQPLPVNPVDRFTALRVVVCKTLLSLQKEFAEAKIGSWKDVTT